MPTFPHQTTEPDFDKTDLARPLTTKPAVNCPANYSETAIKTQESVSDFVTDRPILKRTLILLLIAAALFSMFGLRAKYEQPESWTSQVRIIDEKKANVLALTTAAVTLSAGISAIPDDTGTPIAEQLSQLAGNLGIVLGVLYLEKYLLTILGFLGFGVLIPFSCALFAISILMHNRFSTSRIFRIAGTRILVVAIIALAVIPASVWVTERIDDTYEASIAEQAAEITDDTQSTSSDESSQSSGNFIENLVNAATKLGDTITSGLQSVTDSIITKVNNLIEGAVVMIVTSCMIPLLVLAVFLWLGHTLLGIDVTGPAEALLSRMKRPIHKPTLNASGRVSKRNLA